MGLMGFGAGFSGPSRDILVRRAATSTYGVAAYGRIYGFVYSGIDTGLAIAPLVFGVLMDAGRFAHVLWGVALLQTLAIGRRFWWGRARAREGGQLHVAVREPGDRDTVAR
jgi:MFS family permease